MGRSRGVRGSARSIRIFSFELWQDLVLLDIRKSTFQHLTVHWNFNVLEMALKTLRFVQGLPGTPLLFFFDISKPDFPKIISRKSTISKSGNLKIGKPRFTNKCPDSLTSTNRHLSNGHCKSRRKSKVLKNLLHMQIVLPGWC